MVDKNADAQMAKDLDAEVELELETTETSFTYTEPRAAS
jgi:hypothetical protein